MAEKKTTKKEAPKSETVEVSKSELQALLDTNQKTLERLEAVERTNEVLRDAVSRGRLDQSEAKHNVNQEDQRPRAHTKGLWIDGKYKVILGYKSGKEDPQIAQNGVKDLGNGMYSETVKLALITLPEKGGEPEAHYVDLTEVTKSNDLFYFRQLDRKRDPETGDAYWEAQFEDADADEKYGTFLINEKHINL